MSTGSATRDPEAVGEASALLPATTRRQIGVFGGVLLVLITFGSPSGGLIEVPVTFFLKNRLHLDAQGTATFLLWSSVPLFLSFVFGLLRDRWSPFGAGDRGHLVAFGVATAAIYTGMAFLNPTYGLLLVGLVVVTASYQVVLSAGNGLTSSIGQHHAMAGQMGTLVNVATTLPALAAFLVGGVLSDLMEGREASTAARLLCLAGAGLMVAIAVFGLVGPRKLFGVEPNVRPGTTLKVDVIRLLKHGPIYPVLLIQLLWQFSPAAGTVMQYHLSNTLRASDAQWGAFNALFFGSLLPVFVVYVWVCQRVRLSRLLWFGTVLGVFQMVPLLFIHSATGALWAAVGMGVIGGIAESAYLDLAIRSCPPGLQGTMMMMMTTMYYVAVRFGDLFGTYLYDRHGGFVAPVVATIIVYALNVPLILLVPKRLIATTDGQIIESAAAV